MSTDINGVSAVGEVVGYVYGANRLSQSCFSDILVSGKRAGKAVIDYISEIKRIDILKQLIIDEYARLKSIIRFVKV